MPWRVRGDDQTSALPSARSEVTAVTLLAQDEDRVILVLTLSFSVAVVAVSGAALLLHRVAIVQIRSDITDPQSIFSLTPRPQPDCTHLTITHHVVSCA